MKPALLDSLRKPLDLGPRFVASYPHMALPNEPITLTVAQLEELSRKLATMRHDINNNLSLIVAAVELIKHRPQTMQKMMGTLAEQPSKLSDAVTRFIAEFERALGITKP